MIRFIFILLLAAAIFTGIAFFAIHSGWINQLPSFFYQTLFFSIFATAVIYAYLDKRSKPEFFVQFYLLTMMLKIMSFGVYAYFIISEDKEGAFPNVVFFMMAYFAFTALEIVFLYRKIST